MIRFLVIVKKYLSAIFLISISSFILNAQTTVNTISELRALSPGSSQIVTVLGYYSAGDWGEPRSYNWIQPNSEADNGGTIIVPSTASTGRWIMEVPENYYNVKWFGAKGTDNPYDNDHLYIQKCIDIASIDRKNVFIPIGIYQVSRNIVLDSDFNDLKLFGQALMTKQESGFRVVDENNSTILKLSDHGSTTEGRVIRTSSTGAIGYINNIIVENIGFNGNSDRTIHNGSNGHVIFLYHHNNAGNSGITFENIAAYNSTANGISNYSTNVFFNNLLVYNTELHGINSRSENAFKNLYMNVEVYHSGKTEGFYGVDFGNNSVAELINFDIHHNWAGMKSGASRNTRLINGYIRDNQVAGFRTSDHQEAMEEIFIDNLIVERNGGIGIRILDGLTRKIGKLIVSNNESTNAVLSNCIIDTLITENHKGTGPYESSIVLWGNTHINHLISRNNNLIGVRIGGNVTINSGQIYNNNKAGVFIQSNNTVRLSHIKFWDDQLSPTQTFREIYDDGNATLYYSGLVFDDSAVPPNDRIRVNTIYEVGNVTLIRPSGNRDYKKEDSIEIEALAAAPDATVQKIEYYANNILIGEITESPYNFTWENMETGEYTIKAVATFTDNSQETSNAVTITILSRTKTQSIPLQPGWNTISMNVIPEPNDISLLLSGIEDNLLLLTSQSGKVYWPTYEINDVREWDYHEGYQVFMEERDTLFVTGLQILPEDSPVALTKGWNLIAFFLEEPLPIETAFDGISHSIELVSNNDGNIFWPAIGVNSIGEMQPGEGYRIFALENVSLVYPNTSQNSIALSTSQVGDLQKLSSITSERYKSNRINTGINAILFVESDSFIDGDEIAIWSESNNLLGSGIANGGKVAITVWGKNEIIPDQEFGALPNEKLRLTFWSAADEREYELIVDRLSIVGKGIQDNTDLRFHANTINLLQVSIEDEIPMRYSLVQNFPNPFNPSTTIRYNIPREEKVKLEVYNLLGQKVETLVDDVHQAGSYEIIFKADHLASGVYFYRLSAGNFSEVMRMILLR
jgi:hypothetical protein